MGREQELNGASGRIPSCWTSLTPSLNASLKQPGKIEKDNIELRALLVVPSLGRKYKSTSKNRKIEKIAEAAMPSQHNYFGSIIQTQPDRLPFI